MSDRPVRVLSDEEIAERIRGELAKLREEDVQYAVISITFSGGRVKFLTVEKPLT